ncbi:MAG: TonB-dependent receptor [Aureispira sp.]|nr:TonB-dependent receptor [Aureispira sp.]
MIQLKTLLTITVILLFSQLGNAQYMLKGTVQDVEGTPLTGAIVQLLSDGCNTITDLNGSFQIHYPEDTVFQIRISYTGFETITKQLKSPLEDRVFTFTLLSNPQTINIITVNENNLDNEQSQSQTLIYNQFIEKNNQGTLAKTLENIAGVNAINVGVGIAKPVIRGLSFNRIVVSSQGIKQEGQQWGGDHGLEMDQFDVDRIELVKGARSLQYGSDALGGSINVLPTRIPNRNSIKGSILGIYKSNNHHIGTSAYLGGNIKDIFFDGRFSYQDFGDYNVPTDSFVYNGFVLPIYNRILKNTAGKERNLKGSLGISKDWGIIRFTISHYHLQAGIFSGAMGIPRSYQLQEDGKPRNIDLPKQQVGHWKLSLNNDFSINEHSHIKLNIGYQHNTRKEYSYAHSHNRPVTDSSNIALELNLKTISLNGYFQHQFHKKWKVTHGLSAQYQQNQRSGFEFLIPDFQTIRTGMYHLANFSPNNRLQLSLGLRIDYAYNQTNKYDQAIYLSDGSISTETRVQAIQKHYFNYSAALGTNYQLLPKKWYLRANFSKSFRVPYPNELASNGVHHGNFRHELGNPNLKPEQGYQLDLSTDWQLKKFKGSFATYFNYFDDYIYLGPSSLFSPLPEAGQMYLYQQNDAIYTGFEFQWTYNPIPEFSIEQAYEYVWNINLQTNLSLPFTPPASILSTLRYEYPKLSIFEHIYAQLQYRYSFAQNDVDRNERTTPNYHLLNLGLGWKLRIKNQYIHFNIQVQNILDTAYLQHLSRYRLLNIPEQGRNFVVSLKIPFEVNTKNKKAK